LEELDQTGLLSKFQKSSLTLSKLALKSLGDSDWDLKVIEATAQDGSWNYDFLEEMLPSHVVCIICGMLLPSIENGNDSLI